MCNFFNSRLIEKTDESEESDCIKKALFDLTEESYYNECSEFTAYLDACHNS